METGYKNVRLSTFYIVYIIGQLLWSTEIHCITVQINITKSQEAVPEGVNISLTSDLLSVDLALKRHAYMTFDFPVETVNVDRAGRFVYTPEKVESVQGVVTYHDLISQAVFQIYNPGDSPDLGPKRVMKGQFLLDDAKYFVAHDSRRKRDVTSSGGDYELHVLPDSDSHLYDSPLQASTCVEVEGSRSPTVHPPTVQDGRRRKRRDVTTANYFIDLVVVVDFKAYSRFLSNAENNRTLALTELVQYYAFVISGVDLLYQGINSTDFNIHVLLSKIVVAETASSSPYTEVIKVGNTVDASLCLNTFKNYTLENTAVQNFDHAMLFTGLDITRTESNVVNTVYEGLAKIKSICSTDGNAVSVIEDMGGYACIKTAAHNLGHSLSVNHDGVNNGCSSSDRYIMAAIRYPFTNATRLNPWRFSSCSVEIIRNYTTEVMTTSAGAACLTERKVAAPDIPDVGDRLPGLNVSIDDQCRMTYTNLSSACQVSADQNLTTDPSSVCFRLLCYNPSDGKCYDFYGALDGTTCGNGKLCLYGECVSDSRAQRIQDGTSCLFGDNLSFTINQLTCSQIAVTQPSLCYDSDVRTSCCDSCRSIYRPNQGCEYGDHVTGCAGVNCSTNPTDCCDTCSSILNTTTTAASYVTSASSSVTASSSSVTATSSSVTATSSSVTAAPSSVTSTSSSVTAASSSVTSASSSVTAASAAPSLASQQPPSPSSPSSTTVQTTTSSTSPVVVVNMLSLLIAAGVPSI